MTLAELKKRAAALGIGDDEDINAVFEKLRANATEVQGVKTGRQDTRLAETEPSK